MAHIKINSKIVIGACLMTPFGSLEICEIIEIEKIAKIATYAEPENIYLDHNDFALIGEFLSNSETKLNPGDRICTDCKHPYKRSRPECVKCGCKDIITVKK